jgi:GNAT superfamily N-acetyltransferase
MSVIEILPVSLADVLDAPNAKALFAEYEAECSLPELRPIDPQRDIYAAMERTGAFQSFGVYVKGVLVGFASALTYIVPHYGKRIATVESLFLAAGHRRGRTGNELLNAIEEYARKQGCIVVLYSAPAGSQFERLLRLLKPYRHSNTVFLRSL